MGAPGPELFQPAALRVALGSRDPGYPLGRADWVAAHVLAEVARPGGPDLITAYARARRASPDPDWLMPGLVRVRALVLGAMGLDALGQLRGEPVQLAAVALKSDRWAAWPDATPYPS